MERFRVALILVLVFAITVWPHTAKPLSESDFVIAGISDETSAKGVQKILGKPSSIHSYPHPFDPDARTIQWRYGALDIIFSGESVTGIYLNTAKYATARGLRVGDSTDKLVQLYGSPTGEYETDWDYFVPGNEMHLIRVTLKKKRVSSIYLGWLTD
jgi:hypothetical protein